MLKKAGTVVALVTAGLLAMSPLAFAGGDVDVTDQENEQESAQGNGILNGNNVLSGNALQVCGINVSGLNNVIGALAPIASNAVVSQAATTVQGGGDCNNSGTAVGQSTTQDAENDND
ncbi:MAG: hypothetical protein ACT4RN_03030 [Pseudonocardia sp.]